MSQLGMDVKSRLLALSKHRFGRQVAVLVSGTVLAQGLVMLSSPIITRLYLPEALGIVAIFTSLINLASVLTSAAYQNAVPLPKDDREAVRILQLTLMLLAIASGIALLVLIGLTFIAPQQQWRGALGSYVWLLPAGIFLYGGFRVMAYWPTRKQAFALASRAKLAQSLALVFVQVLAGWLLAGVMGLIVGVLLGALSGLVLLARLPGNASAVPLWKIKFDEIRQVASRYRRFPIYAAVPSFLESLSLDLPVLLLAWMFDAQVAGWCALSQRVLAVPATFIATAVEQAFMGEAAARVRSSAASIQPLLTKMILLMVVVGVPCVAVLAIFGPALFGVVFGGKWVQSGLFVRLLAPMYLMQIVASPTSSTLDVLERQDLYVARVILRLILMPGSMVVAWLLHLSAENVVAVLGITGCLTYVAYLAISLVAARGATKQLA